MLLFRRDKALKLIEEGLQWKAAGVSAAPKPPFKPPEGVFVEVPAIGSAELLEQYIVALGVEAARELCDARPRWIQLRGAGVSTLPAEHIKEIIWAVCPEPMGIGLDLNPRLMEPGDIAGFRAIGVERFCFRMDSPYDKILDPVRRARALGAFTSVEVCISDELNWLSFMHALGRALETPAAQICLCDERSRSSSAGEQMEKAGEKIAAAGYRRLSLWAWAKTDAGFDSLGLQLSGRSANLGPDAFTCRPQAYANPGLQRWLATRHLGEFEVIKAEGGLEHWLALAAGLYALELRRDGLDFRTGRHAAALARMGIVDGKGRPAAGRSMEFCHRVARATHMAMPCGSCAAAPAGNQQEPAVTNDKKGMDAWRTGSGGS